MKVKCIDKDGFEDQLKLGLTYNVVTFKGGSVEVINEKGICRWYGLSKFQLINE